MKTVFVNGCFDLFHSGHLHFLQTAKSFGDRLVVGLNSDESVLDRKGRLYRTETERKALLEALRCVDEVRIFSEETAVWAMLEVFPMVYVTGLEYRGRSVESLEAEKAGITVRYVPRLGEWSTTQEIQRVRGV